MKASELIARCLENEGVQYVFGVPGEEILDIVDSLIDSSVRFIPTRHEQGAAFMADAYGRLTGRAGVCLATLGPGATNLATGVADANLDHAPLVAITGQAGRDRVHKESHQYVDIVELMRPLTKWNTRAEMPVVIPEVIRKAFKVAEAEKPGACHIEVPEDVAEEAAEGEPLSTERPRRPSPDRPALQAAAQLIEAASFPLIFAGNGVIRGGASKELRELRPRPRHSGGQHVHGQGVHAVRRSPRAAHRRAAGARLHLLRLREGRPDHRGGLRPGRVRAQVLEPGAQEAHHPHRLHPRRGGQPLSARGRGGGGRARGARAAQRPGEGAEGSRALSRAAAVHPRAARGGRGRRHLPDQAAAHPARPAAGDGARGHPDLGRGQPQAVDRAHLPGLRAEQRAHLQRPRRDGVRAARGGRGQARAPASARWWR